jgi:hypothetical protein
MLNKLKAWLRQKTIKRVNGITVNYLTLKFEDPAVQKDHEDHVDDGQASVYWIILTVNLLNVFLNIGNYVTNKSHLSFLIAALTALLCTIV